MASFGRRGGVSLRGRRARSASLSSDSSVGGGAPLNADLSDLNLSDSTHHRSASERITRVTAAASSIASSDSFIEDINNSVNSVQQNFQIGKPPQDDEEVFNATEPDPKRPVACPAPIIIKPQTSESQALVPVQAQMSPVERRHLVQGVDAQTYYPAEACIFVANLPESKSDTVLEVAITKAFSVFGPVFVKIRRDPKNMPFAFCQYTDASHAQRAQRDGKGLLVEGRPCRTEMVKANRCYVMFNRKGHQVSISDARSHLLQFGEISKLELLREDAAQTMKLPGAMFVEYVHFDPSRDIISAYRYHEEYGVVAYDLKKINPNQVNHYANYLARYEVDRRSIYVGNLPHNVENIEEILRYAASDAGTVEAVQIIRKEPRHEGGRPIVFAFVEYARPDEALVAVERLRGSIVVNNRIRVEKKKCADQGSLFRGEHAHMDRSEHAHMDRGEHAPMDRGEHAPMDRGEAPVSTSRINEQGTGAPATPARPINTGGVAIGSGGGTDVGQAGSRVMSPDVGYHPVAFPPRGNMGSPIGYNQGRAFVSPNQGYQPSTFTSPAPYGPSQYVSPDQAYQPSQYVSPQYALSPGYQQRAIGQSVYSPATPQVLGAQTPYHGSSGGYFQGQVSPYWRTPYLQDQNDGYQYYAGYGPRQYTPLGAATRSMNTMHIHQTPTRQNEAGAEKRNVETGKKTDEGKDQSEATGEK
ncbi:hypothetical protein F4861DRAFT_539705 [Xylaria intraflava]|nr:hypothetical protein F4861DRAFT_539705 [Xylaria intraflava]